MSNFLFTIPFFLMAIIIHEFSHGWVANKLGDPTARYSGRLTLNPLAHLDPVGSVIMPLLLLFLKSPVIFGWAKPVPINYWNLRNPKRDMLLVGLAGPISNFAIAIILSLLLKLNLSWGLSSLLVNAILINLVFGVFNLIPIPPLDGSRVVAAALPNRYLEPYRHLDRYGVVIIFVLLYLGVFDWFIWPAIKYLSRLLGINVNV